MTRFLALLTLFIGCTMHARGDEGMWLFNEPPVKQLKEKYQVELAPDWLAHAMKANVRFNSGGSGSFVSKDGLIVTNHHIAADALQKLSTKDRDLFALGFLARKQADELKCPDLELNVLQKIDDVTDKVNDAVKGEADPAKAAAARRKIMTEIEAEASKSGLRCDVVTLYQGGAYHLYQYKKYTDVRLVFAPEAGIAAFGGDVDNFEFPRHGLDVSFFRAYEDGKPAVVKDYFPWNSAGPKENELVFVTGHPGTTNRGETLGKLQHRRDFTLPYTLNRLRSLEAALTQYGDQGPEQRRQAATNLHSVANARKAFSGQLQGLLDAEIIKQKQDAEIALNNTLTDVTPGSGKHHQQYTGAVEAIAKVQQGYRQFEKEHALIETGHAFYSDLFMIARHCVRMNAELGKPTTDRLREYRDSNLKSLKFSVYSPAPIEKDLERAKLRASLTFLAETLGGTHPLVITALQGKNPAQRATELVESKLFDVEFRKAIAEGDAKTLTDSTDPMIALARLIDEPSRTLRKRYETEVEEVERQAYAEIAKHKFAVYGNTFAPDATFTLRIAYGTVKGYEVDGKKLPFHTTIAGAFQRADEMKNREPYELPATWSKKKDSLKMDTPFNFVSTADTIGGNSGSPVLNAKGELVGINFDRNRHGLVRNFVYTEVQARHIAVHAGVVVEALKTVYEAKELLMELGVK
jgi:Peptidase S46